MTSTADPAFGAAARRRTGAGLLGILGLILLGQLLTPEPWMYLWPVLPVVGAAALLLMQTSAPALGWLPPAVCMVTVQALHAADQPWAWCLVAGALAGSLLGLAQRRGAIDARRAWAYLPVLVLAIAVPLAPGYRPLVEALTKAIGAEEARQLAAWRAMDLKPEQRVAIEQMLAASSQVEVSLAKHVLPAFLFAWVALLVHLAEGLGRRLAELVRRPLPPVMPFAAFRLPDGAVWLLVAGLTLVAMRTGGAMPVGVNLSAALGLAYGLQGLAVLKAFLTTLGLAPGLVVLLFVFTSLMLGPVVPLAAAGVGLLDHWLDFRRLEPRPEESEAEGDNPWK